jgi:TPP-dependent pyruvate/acetoin dehydrogenase alpha subunit
MNKQDLINFEEDIAEIYKTGAIKGPIHLRDGNESVLLDIFNYIFDKDYVFSTWSNHLHCLLKGVPQEDIKARILQGESMAMNFPEYNFYTSAIVGGICPIATGVAGSLKKQNKKNRVFAFIGDMTFLTGIANECIRYSINHDLPITWIIEDNNKSVDTPTNEAWGDYAYVEYVHLRDLAQSCNKCKISYYKFKSSWPHSGVGTFVSF